MCRGYGMVPRIKDLSGNAAFRSAVKNWGDGNQNAEEKNGAGVNCNTIA
jgi:hypothetical protein